MVLYKSHKLQVDLYPKFQVTSLINLTLQHEA